MVVFRPCSKCSYGLRASEFGFSLRRPLKFATGEVHVGSELDQLNAETRFILEVLRSSPVSCNSTSASCSFVRPSLTLYVNSLQHR